MVRLVVGLGNPGPEYARTRHNAGFWVLDELARRLGANVGRRAFSGLTGEALVVCRKVFLLKPQTYMNRSGEAVRAALAYYRLEPSQLLVICDDLDMVLGKIRLRLQGSSGGHRGLQSIADHLGTTEYPRLKIGIGRPESRDDVVDYVLGSVSGEERDALAQAVTRAADAAEAALTDGVEAAMNRFNGN
ncbi:MAG: aminoacyl-tRNA hydrolase [Bacillota bacterium]